MNDDPRLLILADGGAVAGAIVWTAITLVIAVIVVALAIVR